MDEDTGNNSELEHADTRCGGQENIEELRASGRFGGHKMDSVTIVRDC